MARRKKKDRMVSFRLPSDVREQFEVLAREAGITPSAALRNLVQRCVSGELRFWPMALPDLRGDRQPSEGELLALAELLSETRATVQAAAKTIDREGLNIGNACARLGKGIRKVSRLPSFLDTLEGLFNFGGEQYNSDLEA